MIEFYSCSDCRFTSTSADETREHMDDTWHRVTTARLDRYAGRRYCPKDQCMSWPCKHTRPAPVFAPTEDEGGEPLRFPVKLTSGPRAGFELCERHAAGRHDWLTIDPGSDLGKRLAVPGITLVQIGSPYVQLKYGEHWTDKFRRLIADQVEVINSICAQRTACRNLVPPFEGNPRQHCTSPVCPAVWMEHRASYCREIQPEPCGCPECTVLYESTKDEANQS